MLKIFFWIILSFLAGGIGSAATAPAIQGWYAGLAKPFFNPPNWIFGPVWTLLYLMMGIAMGMVANSSVKDTKLKQKGYAIFITQLILNSSWSIVFFGLQRPLAALGVILILLAAIVYTIRIFHKIKPLASYLLYPYLAWVAFASLLNVGIVILN